MGGGRDAEFAAGGEPPVLEAPALLVMGSELGAEGPAVADGLGTGGNAEPEGDPFCGFAGAWDAVSAASGCCSSVVTEEFSNGGAPSPHPRYPNRNTEASPSLGPKVSNSAKMRGGRRRIPRYARAAVFDQFRERAIRHRSAGLILDSALCHTNDALNWGRSWSEAIGAT